MKQKVNRNPSQLRKEIDALHHRNCKLHSLVETNLHGSYLPPQKMPETFKRAEIQPDSAPSAHLHNTSQQVIPEVNLAPKTLEDSFKQIAVARLRSRDTYYTLVASAYAVLVIGFIDKSPEERNENVVLLNAECAKHPNITLSDDDCVDKKVAMLALGTSEQRSQIYDIVHVLKVAKEHKKQVSEIVPWCIDDKGVQGIRRKYKADGTLRDNSNVNGNTKGKNNRLYKLKKSDAEKISTQLSKKCMGVINAVDLLDVKPPANGIAVTCTAIVTKEPDGSLNIREIVEHAEVLAYAYAAVALHNAANSTPPATP